MSILERHADKWDVAPNGCYVWTGAIAGRQSYRTPQINVDGKTRNLPRMICEEVNGPPPTSKYEAAHATLNGCIGSICVAPHHLRWATRSENTLDMSHAARQDKSSLRWKGKRTYDLPRWITFYKKDNRYVVTRLKKYVGRYVTLDEAIAALNKQLEETK